ncbi:NAD(P)-binding protein [Microthyrium microscopicum]|uniref:NAD(P)-binding protein n=1 Tax=Microthyrium microscopicum TaxID=703497 RepID=A0A6A6UKK3_9PEZI|nr:NAD(P)-binding protein [Microthyrium microscopicum]
MAQSSSNELAGKIALVTGASRGIGAAICEVLAGKGANLILNYTSESSTQRTQGLASRIQSQYGVKAIVVQADMGTTDGPGHIIEQAVKSFADLGLEKADSFQLDILINNAGVSVNLPIEECHAEDFAFQYNINVRGPLLLMKAAIDYLPHDRSGRIVNLSSVSASLGFVGQSVYGGTKAALEAMTRTWARELAPRATVNAVNPGPVATDMVSIVIPWPSSKANSRSMVVQRFRRLPIECARS